MWKMFKYHRICFKGYIVSFSAANKNKKTRNEIFPLTEETTV